MTDDATLAQNRAAEPDRSVWLSANAGSGKTRVLTDRVARLLLGGTPPQNVLCLTFTKAAAGEMQNRLFRRLGEWAMLPDAPLRAALDALEAGPEIDLAVARRLFARAIETPGGLKIQTIHSFCAALLRQFPLEAGVSPGFTEMDDSAQRHLMAEVLEEMAGADPDGAIADLAALFLGEELDRLLLRIAGLRSTFPDRADEAAVLLASGVPEGVDEDAIIAGLSIDPSLMSRLISALATGSTNDVKAAATLSTLDWSCLSPSDLPLLEKIFLYGEKAASPFGSKAGKFPTAPTRKTLGPDSGGIDSLMDRVADARPIRLALAAARDTLRLHRFAGAFLPAYAAAKSRRGWLDFDDLIDGAARLLSESDAADWVLYRMDGRIDHILVDEAQDTSPAQWRVIEALAREFAAGQGARDDVIRTLFVVGDKKQSIYSFQGADAEGFDRMQAALSARLGGDGLQEEQLLHSFRSAPAILRAVDMTFDGPAGDGVGQKVKHLPFHQTLPGRVDLWPLVPKPDTPEDPDWTDPVDRVSADHPSRTLAQKLACEIRRMIDEQVTIPVRTRDGTLARRPVTEGDILILVQTRQSAGRLFDALISACKEQGLAMAGADRISLARELAVRDITALLSFLALPEDDLSLAAALRSPLFGWDEDRLYRLAAPRPDRQTLWEALRKSDATDTMAVIGDLLKRADFQRPYDLIEHILVSCDGRRRLTARLGAEVEDGIDELLAQALAFERQSIPDLTGFLVWLAGEATEVKRQTDMTGNAIQVMTVHGAKGLERPVVILPDTLRGDGAQREAILPDAGGLPHWRPSSADMPPPLSDAATLAAEAQRRERNRLLYVAMTRAETWLIVCGGGDGDGSKDGQWYGLVKDGLTRAGADPATFPTGEGLRLLSGDWTGPPLLDDPDSGTPDTPLPDWARTPPPAPIPGAETLSPSALPGPKALPGEAAALSQDDALRRGRQMHLLLELLPGLPEDQRRDAARDILRHAEDPATGEEAGMLAAQATAIVSAPHLSHLFAPGALREVPICADLAGRRLIGTIDVLIVDDTRLHAIDFKTNAVIPATPAEVPAGILAQMGAYRAALADIFPHREIALSILWTADARLMTLPNDIVMEALAAATAS